MPRLSAALRNWLAHPLTRGLDIDDPKTTLLRRQIIREKRFLHRLYLEWYAAIVGTLPANVSGPVLELGAGAGFLREHIADLITSEVFACPDITAVLDGRHLPFSGQVLRGIVMTDVLHHIPEPARFFAEAARCVKAGGVVTCIEPWVTAWSRRVYTHLHHEPFLPAATEWDFPAEGPLSGANGALPWILFERDRAQFERLFPDWRIRQIRLFMPFRYVVSGGVSLRSLVPAWSFAGWRGLETLLSPFMNSLAMFALISLQKRMTSRR